MTTSAKSAADLQPTADRLVVRPTEQSEISAGGIFLPDTAKERPQVGEVLAVGPGRVLKNGRRLPMELAVGDSVIYSKYAGTEISVDNEDLLVLGSNDVLAKLT